MSTCRGADEPFDAFLVDGKGRDLAGGRMEKQVLQARANPHKYKVTRNCWLRVRDCAMNAMEHFNGGGNHQHVGHTTTSSGLPRPSY